MVESCEKCKKEVKKNEEAMELSSSKIYHAGCFRCDHCDLVFGDQPFVPVGNTILHKHCYEDVHLQKCNSCGKKIQSKYIVLGNKKIHSECFKCDTCGDDLSSQQYVESNGQKFCSVCATKKRQSEQSASQPAPKTTTSIASFTSSNPAALPSTYATISTFDTDQLINCPICSKRIFPSEKSISIHTNKAFHQACLKCSLCGNIFEDGKFHQEGGKYYHKQCLQDLHTPKCDKCHKSMSSFVQFKNQKLHQECFSCSRCSKAIGAEGAGETSDGQILCMSCQRKWQSEQQPPEQESKTCYLCHKSLSDGMVVRGNIIHKDCFRCGICEKPLRKEDAITEDRGFFLHVDCLRTEVEEKCDKCGKFLNENYITLNGGNYHEECVTCSSCNCSLANIRFTEKDGGLFCKNCLPTHKVMDTDSKSGSTLNTKPVNTINVPDGSCPKCLKKVYMSDTVNGPRATTWHRACLVCTVCRKPLDTYAVLLEGQVFCTSHGRRK